MRGGAVNAPMLALSPTPDLGAFADVPHPRRRRADLENDLFATIVEEASAEILVFDAETLGMIFANRSSRNNLDYEPEQIGGLSMTDIQVEFSEARLRELHRPLIESETTGLVVHTSHRRRDNTVYPVEVHSRTSVFNGRPVIFQIVADQTATKLEQVRAELTSLIERDAAEARDNADFLASLLARLSAHFRCQMGHVYLWKQDTGRLESAGIWHTEIAARWQEDFRRETETMPMPSGEGLPGLAHRRKKLVVMRNLGSNPACIRHAAFSGTPISTGFAIPAIVGGQPLAVLEFFSVYNLTLDFDPDLIQSLEDQIGRLFERMLIEEEANESRERFIAAVNGAAVGLWDYNYKTGQFYLSPRCREILGIPDCEPTPTWDDYAARIHPKDVRRTAAAMKAHMLRRTPYDIEYRYRHAEGRYVWIHSRARGVWDEAGNIVRTAGTLEDIEAEKEAEQVQREVLVCITAPSDAATKITEALDKVCRFLDLPTAIVSQVTAGDFEIKYRSSNEAGPKVGDVVALASTISSDVYSGDSLQAFPDLAHSLADDHPARLRDGIESYIGLTLFVRGVRFGTLSFHSPRPRKAFNEAEVALVRLLGRWIGEEIGRATDVAALIENNERTSSKLASAADALLTVNADGKIEDVNPAAAQMFLWTAEELRNMAIGALLPTARAFTQADGRLIPVQGRQDVAVRKDGERVSVLLGITEIHVGRRTLYTVAISDLTRIKQAEVAKGEFISIVSHELRTPLTSIRGALSLVANEIAGPLTPESSKLAKLAERNCERLLHLVNDILDMEKLESGRFEIELRPVDLNLLLSDVTIANAPYADKYGASFHLTLAPDLPYVIADSDRLIQVMANLLSNAAKFTRPGTVIDVVSELAGRCVLISVRDQGQGIPENMRERVFEKFVQAESVNTRGHEGSGLGLSITHKLVELMNGEISFSSETGVGTTFTVGLPIVDADLLPEKARTISSGGG